MARLKTLAKALAVTAAFAVSACAGGAFTGPVEVTRFVAPQAAGLGQGTIVLRFSQELKNEAARDAFRAAISDQLSLQGYTVIANADIAGQIATIDTSRNPVESGTIDNPVSVGVGAGAGTFGSGAGLGVGINLGGTGDRSPRVISQLSIAIARKAAAPGDPNLWEARAQFPTSVNSPYTPVDVSARTLAAAVFRNFPQASGQTISLKASDLVETP